MNSSRLSLIKKITLYSFITYVIIYFIVLSWEIFVETDNLLLNSYILTNFGNIMAIIIIIIGIRNNIVDNKITWYMFFIGLVFRFISDFIFLMHELIFSVELTFPSICDFFNILGATCFFAALILFIKNKRIGMIFVGFDSLIIMVVSATLIIYFILQPIWADETLSDFEKFLELLYPIIDLGYIGALITLLYISKRHKLNSSRLLLMIAFFIYFVADMIFAIVEGRFLSIEIYTDMFWPSAAIILGFSSLFSQPSEAKSTINSYDETYRKKDMLYFFIPYFCIGILMLLVCYKYMLKDTLITGALIAIILVILRQIFFVYENKRLLKELKNVNEKLHEKQIESEEEANTDFLTGIYNRRYIHELIKSNLFIDKESNLMKVAVLVIDIDYFKQINDSFGHTIGDHVLKEVALDIKEVLREDDKIGRFGGDEFIVFMPENNKEILKKVAERIIRKVTTKTYADDRLMLTLSIGGALYNGNIEEFDSENFFNNADKVLYEVKESGRNNYKIF